MTNQMIDHMLSDQQKKVWNNHDNLLVKLNREFMNCYIDAVCYLAKAEQAFRGQVGSSGNRYWIYWCAKQI